MTAKVEVPEDFREQIRQTAQAEYDDQEWQVWVTRNGAGYDTGAFVTAESEAEALERAEHTVALVLDGVGASFRRDSGYEVEVRRLIA